MKVTCQACSAQYTIADDKVRGRKVKIRCKACQNPIVVDGQLAAPEGQGDSAEGASQLEALPTDNPGAGEADVWNVNLSETDSRTMTTSELVEGYQSGAITSEAFVWRDGMGDWVPLLECAELAPLLGTAAAPAGAGPAQRAASAKADPAADLFGDIDVAGSEEDEVDVATSARAFPTLPGSTAYDDKPTGQRNENSVLFSLDAMKAGFSPQPPPRKPKPEQASRPTQASNPDDPFGMGASGGIAALGSGGNPLFNLTDNQALLTAPAPPPPEPKGLSVPGLSVAAAPAYRETDNAKKKRLFLFGGIGAGAVALVAVMALAMGGKKDESSSASEPQASADAKTAASPQPDKAEKPAPDTPSEPAPTAKTEEPKAEEPKAEEPKPAEPPVAAADPGKAVAKPVGGSAAPAPKKEEPATASAPFSRSAAVSALGAAANQASACKKPGGPTGVGKVQVTFANSGRVTSASVSGGPFAGTAVGGCVAGAFRRAKVPPFSGNPVTVSKSFQIN